MILFSTGWDLSVVHRGWALLDIATGVLVGCLDLSPWAGTVANDWPSVGWGPWSLSGEAAIRGVAGLQELLQVVSCRMALSSCRDVCGFCRGLSHLLPSLYRIAHLLVLLFLHWTMSASCLGKWHYSDCLAFHQWWQLLEAGFTYITQTYAEQARCLAPPLGCFSSLVVKENNRLLMLWLSWLSSLQSWLRFLLVHCFGGSPGSWLHAQSQMITKSSQILQS